MLTQQTLKEYLHYCPTTGIFTWIKSRKDLLSTEAGSIYKRGYKYITLLGSRYMAHRLAWLYMYGTWPNSQIDHINHVRTDNRINNLREVGVEENSRNKSRALNNTSGATGVTWNPKISKWKVRIGVKGKRVHIGYFNNMQEAVLAREQSKIDYGFHPNHGN